MEISCRKTLDKQTIFVFHFEDKEDEREFFAMMNNIMHNVHNNANYNNFKGLKECTEKLVERCNDKYCDQGDYSTTFLYQNEAANFLGCALYSAGALVEFAEFLLSDS